MRYLQDIVGAVIRIPHAIGLGLCLTKPKIDVVAAELNHPHCLGHGQSRQDCTSVEIAPSLPDMIRRKAGEVEHSPHVSLEAPMPLVSVFQS